MESRATPLVVVRAARARLKQLDDTLALAEARIQSRERVESVWRQATDFPRERREVCRSAVLAR